MPKFLHSSACMVWSDHRSHLEPPGLREDSSQSPATTAAGCLHDGFNWHSAINMIPLLLVTGCVVVGVLVVGAVILLMAFTLALASVLCGIFPPCYINVDNKMASLDSAAGSEVFVHSSPSLHFML